MLRVGDYIQSYKITAITSDGTVFAVSATAPESYVTWNLDRDGCGVYGGKYSNSPSHLSQTGGV